MRGTGLIGAIYLVIGVLVAAMRGYFGGIDGIPGLISALLAILLWPLVLLGVDLHIGRRARDGKGALALVVPLWTYASARLSVLVRARRDGVSSGIVLPRWAQLGQSSTPHVVATRREVQAQDGR